jgi:hypothetical protein
MCFEILYEKQFIDLGDGRFIPLLMSGSNNTWEASGKRCRDWWVYRYIFDNNKSYGTYEEMKSNLKSHIDVGDTFTKNGKGLSFKQYCNLFNVGCKQALTVEQLAQVGVTVRAFARAEHDVKEPFDVGVKSTGQLIELLDGCNDDNTVKLTLSADESKIAKVRKEYFPRIKKPTKDITVDIVMV